MIAMHKIRCRSQAVKTLGFMNIYTGKTIRFAWDTRNFTLFSTFLLDMGDIWNSIRPQTMIEWF